MRPSASPAAPMAAATTAPDKSSRARRHGTRRLPRRRLAKDSQRVVAKDLGDRVLAQPGAKERVGEKRQARGVPQIRSRHDEAVPIRAEGGRILSGRVDDVTDVAHDVVDARAAEKARAENDAD